MKNLPIGTRYILWMDMAAQYSFYGMNAILPLFLLNNIQMNEVKIVTLMQLFLSWRYIAMIATSIISETLLTQKTLMLIASVISVLGHIALSYDTKINNVYLGLLLIAIGIGIIKICIQPLIVYQTSNNLKLSSESLSWLYIFTNIGTISVIITPLILQIYGYQLAFMSPTILVLISTVILIIGNKYIQNPPLNINKKFISLIQIRSLLKWLPLIVIISIFEAFFAQMYSSWAVQGKKMDCMVLGWQISPVQLQILDTIFIITLVPLIVFKILPYIQKRWNLLSTIASQLSFGFVCAGASFVIISILQVMLEKNNVPSLLFQTPAFFLLSLGEIMVLCIGRNLLYAAGKENLRIKIAMLYAILSLTINSLATFSLSFFTEINSVFFGACSIALIAISILLKLFNIRKRT